jgi:sugar lactone lactonase YvrE
MVFLSACKKHSHSDGDGGDPQISSFTPGSAAKDSIVVISGANFSSVAADNLVAINGVTAVVVAANASSLSIKVPIHAGIGKISVKVRGKTATSAKDFGYLYTVSTLAGDGNFGFKEGPGPIAEFNSPNSLALDGSGNLYVADVINNRIRKITPDGVVSTLAGSTKGYKEGQGADAKFYYPYGVAGNSDVLYVADANNNRIRKLTLGGDVSAFAGDGAAGHKEGAGSVAEFKNQEGVAVDGSGNIYVADTYNSCIRKITPAGEVSTLAGNGMYGFKDGAGSVARFSFPTGVAVDGNGNVYVADVDNNRIRKITPAGMVSTLAGEGSAGYNDGQGAMALFNNPGGVAVDKFGNVFVAEYINSTIRKITPDGYVYTVAGHGVDGFREGPGPVAAFTYPSGVVVDGAGTIYVADAGNYRIRKLE